MNSLGICVCVCVCVCVCALLHSCPIPIRCKYHSWNTNPIYHSCNLISLYISEAKAFIYEWIEVCYCKTHTSRSIDILDKDIFVQSDETILSNKSYSI